MAVTQVKLTTGETLEIERAYSEVRSLVTVAMAKRNELVKFTAKDIGEIEVMPDAIVYIYALSP